MAERHEREMQRAEQLAGAPLTEIGLIRAPLL
jgi:hypothetical protein